ncbi:MAG: hypothetical protein ACREQ5_27650, partial [Candidatus Dormibacteria bacterium]
VKTAESWDFHADQSKMDRGDYTVHLNLSRFKTDVDAYVDMKVERRKYTIVQVSGRSYKKATQDTVDSVFNSKLVRFIAELYNNHHNLYTNFFNSLPYLDPEKKWTDAAIYKQFGLNKAEIEYIEEKIHG